MIREGVAILVSDLPDLLDMLDLTHGGRPAEGAGAARAGHPETRARDLLSVRERTVLDALPSRGALDLGALVRAAGLPQGDVLASVGILTASGWAVEDAGGTMVVITLPEGGLDIADPNIASIVASAAADGQSNAAAFAEVLRSEWSTAGARPLTDALVAADLVTVEGLEGDATIYGVVDLAASEGEPDALGVAIARAFSDAGAPALGAQTSTRDTGVARASAAAGISAIDTLGGDVGRYSLVALLTGATPGFYGTGEGATALFPPTP
jgi:hypothetical protein